MIRNRSVRALACLMAVVLITGACQSRRSGNSLTIGVSLSSGTIPFFVSMARGIKDRAAELSVDVVVSEAGEDPLKQLDHIRAFVNRRVDGILISPVDAQAAIPAYEAARKKGIPIISIARRTSPELEDGFVGADEARLAADIAGWTCRALHGAGKVAMLNGPPGASFVRIMQRSYKKYMADRCPGVQIVFESHVSPMSPTRAVAVAKDALTAHPDLDAFYGNVDDLAAGAIQALEEHHALDRILVTGFDGTRVDLVREGKLDLTVALRPYHWGALGLETITKRLRDKTAPKTVEIGALLVDEANVATLDAADLR